ncbi:MULTISPECIES: restriction endonuclease subunit S [Aerococcus]|uniref:restriction endonuclease subunit S n=1 Tax=Aerococcus TaxID=1375 RepID=UPI0027E26A18|nr:MULTISPECIES: restriction endonuclease subunit S [Aerococcus]
MQDKLHELTVINSGKDYKNLSEGHIPVYGTGGYMLSVNKSLSDIDAVGLGRKGTIDNPIYLKAPFWTVDTLFYITTQQQNNIMFFYYLFKTINWKKYNEASGVPSLSKQTIYSISVKVPNTFEQSKISKLFYSLDRIITLEQQKIEKLELLKQYLLQNMFADESGYPRVRFKGYNNKWERSKLNTISDSYSGLSGKTKEDFGKGEARYIEYKNVFDNPVAKLDGTDAIDIDYKQNEVKKGDFLFTTSSETPEEVGMSSLWDYDLNNIYLNSFCFGVRIKEKIDSYYLAYYFRSPEFRSRVMKLAQGISRYNISKNKFCELKISVPSYEEGVRIGRLLKSTTDLIDLEENKLKEFKLIKSKLLQSLFI